ncbi:beta-agarase [Rubellicoccus peritrichatus]|uniref:Beta-agarase n=1 Tax=Rubellicoccus peritrichatus TaxID=3080537 RepID=A0AAQ3LC79_9BACT|nr:beta-agarase [Puniceicoccus sp. CR14]WOO40858.1 beta-agarase [Puniceicoccus sp. CR14]
MKTVFSILTTSVAIASISTSNAQTNKASEDDADKPVVVNLDPTCVRSIGGITEFNRDQFITIHASPHDGDMLDEDYAYLENELEISYGRDGGHRTGIRNQTEADPDRPDFPDVDSIREHAENYKQHRANGRPIDSRHLREMIHCTHPQWYFASESNTSAPFGPTTMEGAAEFTAQFLKHFWTDENRPKYLEVFNEPFVHKKDIEGATIEGFSEQHVIVARRIKELTPDVLVGGYTAAWAELEHDNFGHWDRWQKKFMDIAGEDMDFFSTHIYDGINVVGEARNRTGSNSEAIIDTIDQYSWLSYGVAKPQVISEYGLIPEGNMGSMPYSPKRSAAMIRSTNAQLMTFMDHPDRLLKTIPFFLGKALWTYNMKGETKPGEANPFLLWRRLADGSFVKTDLVMFYQFWKGVHGEWRCSNSSDPDLRCHFLADGKRLNVIMMNIEDKARKVQLNGLGKLNPTAVTLRTMRTDGEAPVLAESKLKTIPASLDLAPGESALLMIDLSKAITPTKTSEETRNYATSYMHQITASEPIEFDFEDVPTGEGSAILRLSIGREKDKSVHPTVHFNGTQLTVPTDWAGDDQAGRATFFGMIEVPVPMDLISETNTTTISFPDSGGKVASAVLQVNELSPM